MPSELPAEFALIARHFRPLAGPGALDLQDDAAVLAPPPGRDLVLTCDAMVAGVHFLPDDPPDLVGRKLLRVNLSDLAAKGARPIGYLMTVSTPRDTPDAWFAGFSAGLNRDQHEFGVTLLGGDTTSTPGPSGCKRASPGATTTNCCSPSRQTGSPTFCKQRNRPAWQSRVSAASAPGRRRSLSPASMGNRWTSAREAGAISE